jgi:hypothetical protein
MKSYQKKAYQEPCMTVLRTAPMQMLATSGDPEVQTTSEKASTDYDALVKGSSRSNYSVWDDDWNE